MTDNRTRRSLWNYLAITFSTSLPWCAIGDFNAILLASEKLSTRPPSAYSVKDFNDMVLATGLIDLGFKGNFFTWANNRNGLAYAATRLDKAFSNSAWRNNFIDPVVKHLPRICFDHSPILLSHRIRLPTKNPPFKFEPMWLSHATFDKVVENRWAVSYNGNPQFVALNLEAKS